MLVSIISIVIASIVSSVILLVCSISIINVSILSCVILLVKKKVYIIVFAQVRCFPCDVRDKFFIEYEIKCSLEAKR